MRGFNIKPEIFQQGENYIRWDWRWYGVGRSRTCFCFAPASYAQGTQWWINTYRTAPIAIRTLHVVGVLDKRPARKFFTFAFCGSGSNPRRGWALGMGRAYIGGDTPKFIIKLLRVRDERRWSRMEESQNTED